jgi:hypothetical protein
LKTIKLKRNYVKVGTLWGLGVLKKGLKNFYNRPYLINVITLKMITITKFLTPLNKAPPHLTRFVKTARCDIVIYLITLTMITLSGTHFINKTIVKVEGI